MQRESTHRFAVGNSDEGANMMRTENMVRQLLISEGTHRFTATCIIHPCCTSCSRHFGPVAHHIAFCVHFALKDRNTPGSVARRRKHIQAWMWSNIDMNLTLNLLRAIIPGSFGEMNFLTQCCLARLGWRDRRSASSSIMSNRISWMMASYVLGP